MSSNKQSNESFFERHAWKVFFFLSLIVFLFGLGDITTGGATFEGGEAPTVQGITGMTWQELTRAAPQGATMIDYMVRAGGINLLILGLFSLVVSVTAFRQGQPWAWFLMWLWPAWLAMIIVLLLSVVKQPGPGVPPPLVSGSIFMMLTVLALALSYRKFFPKPRFDRSPVADIS